jgi:hypothetical protein
MMSRTVWFRFSNPGRKPGVNKPPGNKNLVTKPPGIDCHEPRARARGQNTACA